MKLRRGRSASKGVQALAKVLLLALASATGSLARGDEPRANIVVRDGYGAIVRGDVDSKRMALIFTGDEFGESAAPILDVLQSRRIKGSFFLTGNFLRRSEFKPLVRRMEACKDKPRAELLKDVGDYASSLLAALNS